MIHFITGNPSYIIYGDDLRSYYSTIVPPNAPNRYINP